MDFKSPVSTESIERSSAALTEHNFHPIHVHTKAEALAKIQELIPAGASINNGSSRTLDQIGFTDLLKSGTHAWNNLHEVALKETDPAKQGLLRKQLSVADFYLGSVHALTETGEMLIASATGSQLPGIVYNAQNMVLVVGAQKIVPTLADAFTRLKEYVIPLEDERMKQVYGVGTLYAKSVILHHEHPMMQRMVYVIIVDEALGF